MAVKLHPHADIIDALGRDLIRTQFELTHQGLYAWRVRGVPYTHRGAVAQIALLKAVALPSDFLAPPERAAA